MSVSDEEPPEDKVLTSEHQRCVLVDENRMGFPGWGI